MDIKNKILLNKKLGIKPIVFCDMDGVLVDFEKGARLKNMDCKDYKMIENAYLNLEAYPHGFEILDEIEKQLGVEVYLSTKIPDDNPLAATEKLLYLRKLYNENKIPKHRAVNVIITNNKGVLGSEYDYLIDDRPHKAKVEEFKGQVLHFGSKGKYKNWKEIVDFFGIVYCFD